MVHTVIVLLKMLEPLARAGNRALLRVVALTAFLFACSAEKADLDPVAGAVTNAPNTGATDNGPVDTGVGVINTTAREQDSKFLSQATFGPSLTEIEAMGAMSPSTWILAEFDKPATLVLPKVQAQASPDRDAAADLFWEHAITADDQLRQRVAYALSQIFVVSQENTMLRRRPLMMASYMDILANNAFGNFRDLLEDITYSPAMGIYLTYLGNRKEDTQTGRVPDENYAREILQLFTIGLVELNPDGTPRLDSQGNEIETYNNTDITGLAAVFTGLAFDGYPINRGVFRVSTDDPKDPALYSPMWIIENEHGAGEKRFLDTVIPANTPAAQSIGIALDALVDHPNTPPFFARLMIQRFTDSNPSPAYVFTVAEAFRRGTFRMPNGDLLGSGIRGDMKAVIAAILLSREARVEPGSNRATGGKVREPVLRFTHWARAFNVNSADATLQTQLNSTSAGKLGQHPYKSPSVFNFYRPGYVPPGTQMGDLGLVAPELQIADGSTIVGTANFLTRFVTRNQQIDPGSFQPDYSSELALADDPEALVDHLDLILTYGSLSDDSRTRIINILNEIDLPPGDADARQDRVQSAILLVLTSSDYQVLD